MRSLLVVTAFGTRLGGSDNILWSYLRNVDRDRIEPTVVFLEPGPFADEVAGLGLRTYVIPGGRMRNPVHVATAAARLTRILRAESPDLILNWLSTAHLYGGLAAGLAGMSEKTIWWQLDMHMGGALSRGRVLDQLACAIPSAAIGACSKAAAAHQRELWPRRPTYSVLPGIPEPSSPSGEELAAMREELSLAPGIPVIGTIGRLFRWKGHHVLLEAVARLNEEGLVFQALVVGGGGHRGDRRYEADLRAAAARGGLAGKVAFTGQVPDATRYLGLMDVFASCSSPEPFGLGVVEAMASETATVAVGTGGPLEIIEPGISGILAPSDSPGDLAAAIEPLLADDAGRALVASGGRQRFEARFREETMAADMTELFEELSS